MLAVEEFDLELISMRTAVLMSIVTTALLMISSISLAQADHAQVVAKEVAPSLRSYLAARVAEFDQIPDERKRVLEKLALYIQKRNQVDEPARLIFICTHNSRRSQISQVWAMTAARYYGLDRVEAYSGGTESTAFNPRAVAALRRAGLEIDQVEESDKPEQQNNPRYVVRLQGMERGLLCFSKVYDEAPNPRRAFAAVMCCSQADTTCPIVSGCSLRIALPYEDPKRSDNLPEEAQTYDERCEQICREMMYLFSHAVR